MELLEGLMFLALPCGGTGEEGQGGWHCPDGVCSKQRGTLKAPATPLLSPLPTSSARGTRRGDPQRPPSWSGGHLPCCPLPRPPQCAGSGGHARWRG